tara:strand:+ start:82 stop:414 length:333 start_codon:yes stop_codon:yes gene_type:complete
MHLYQKYTKANQDKDADAFLKLIHKDFSMVSHAHGVTGNREEFASMVYFLMGRGKTIKIENERCLYENEHTLVEHKIMSFPDGRREAVMSVWMKKDGKLASLETGATPLT